MFSKKLLDFKINQPSTNKNQLFSLLHWIFCCWIWWNFVVVPGVTQLLHSFLYIIFLAEYNYRWSFIGRFDYNLLAMSEVLSGFPFWTWKVISWCLILQKFDLIVYIISDLFNIGLQGSIPAFQWHPRTQWMKQTHHVTTLLGLIYKIFQANTSVLAFEIV